MNAAAYQREVVLENFGDLGPAELGGFLRVVIEQFRVDLLAIAQGGEKAAHAALHRIAGSAPSVGCVGLGALARASMASPPPTPPEVVPAIEDAMAWLEQLTDELNKDPKELGR